MPRVSVIIPVYRTERYLGECLDSVLAQGLDDIEVVCVNDGSPDGSAAVLTEYANRDRRLVVLEQENRGLSAARNAGVAAARGEYLHFLDSDDRVARGIYETLFMRARQDALDILYFDAVPFYESADVEAEHSDYKEYYQRGGEYQSVMKGSDLMAALYEHNAYRPSAALQLIRGDFYRAAGLAFHEGILHEDNAFTFISMLKADRTAYVPHALYERRIRADSIMTVEKTPEHFRGYLVCYLEALRFLAVDSLDSDAGVAAAKLCGAMYQHALKILCALPEADRSQALHLPMPPDGLVALGQLERQCKDMRKLKGKARELDRYKASRAHQLTARVLRHLRSFNRGTAR